MSKKYKVILIILAIFFLLFIVLIYRYGFRHLYIIFQRLWHTQFSGAANILSPPPDSAQKVLVFMQCHYQEASNVVRNIHHWGKIPIYS